MSTDAPALLPVARSLPDELARALAGGMPLVVMVSLAGCVFCKVARENFLAPARREQGLPVVQVDLRTAQPIRDLRGQLRTHDQLAREWGVQVTPTVLFFGRGGAEVAERLVGGYIPDFYGAYLAERVERARASLRT